MLKYTWTKGTRGGITEGNNKRPVLEKKAGEAGYDLASERAYVVPAGGRVLVSTGLKMALPQGHYGQICSRSGLASKGLCALGGVVDSDYRGEVKVILNNFGKDDYHVLQGERIAQLVVIKIFEGEVRAVEGDLESTKRGDRGFGSSGRVDKEKES